MSALLALQLAGTSLPAEIAQEAGVDAGRGESPAEVAKEQEAAAEEKASPTQRGQGTSPQPDGTTDDTPNEVDKKENTPSQTDQAAAAEADADEPAVAEAEKDAIASAEAVALTAASEDDAVVLTAQDAQNAVTYIDESGQPAARDQYTLIDAEPEGDATITLANGWYVVQSQVVATKRVEIQGHAHLILCDGANLIAQKGVHNAKGSTLSVYGQAEHTGELRATGEDTAHSASIGGNEGEKAGTFNAFGARTVAQGRRVCCRHRRRLQERRRHRARPRKEYRRNGKRRQSRRRHRWRTVWRRRRGRDRRHRQSDGDRRGGRRRHQRRS